MLSLDVLCCVLRELDLKYSQDEGRGDRGREGLATLSWSEACAHQPSAATATVTECCSVQMKKTYLMLLAEMLNLEEYELFQCKE